MGGNFEGLFVERFGFLIFMLGAFQLGHAVETLPDLGMFSRQRPFSYCQGSLDKRLGLLIAVLLHAHDGQVVENGSQAWALRSDGQLENTERALVQWRRLGIFALAVKKIRQIVQAMSQRGAGGALRTLGALVNANCLFEQRLSCRVLVLLSVQATKSGERHGYFRSVCSISVPVKVES